MCHRDVTESFLPWHSADHRNVSQRAGTHQQHVRHLKCRRCRLHATRLATSGSDSSASSFSLSSRTLSDTAGNAAFQRDTFQATGTQKYVGILYITYPSKKQAKATLEHAAGLCCTTKRLSLQEAAWMLERSQRGSSSIRPSTSTKSYCCCTRGGEETHPLRRFR